LNVVLALSLLLLAAEPPLPTGVPAPVRGNNPFLKQAKENYQKLDFEKCLQRLAQAPQWKSAAAELVEIELYAGMCHFNLNQSADAEERFRLALRLNPEAELPAYTSPRIVDFFLGVKRKLKLPPPASKEWVEAPAPKEEPAPKKAEPPAAVKKIEPDEPKAEPLPRLLPVAKPGPVLPPQVTAPLVLPRYRAPIALGVVAVIAVGTGIALGLNARSLQNRANAARFESDFHELGDAAQTNAALADVSYAVGGASALGAVLAFAFSGD
jgi:hypothetical protein